MHDDEQRWTVDQVLAYLAAEGRPLSRSTWYAYNSREQVPAPEYTGRTPTWNPAEIRDWHERTRLRHKTQPRGSD